jgi:hypothetical protein
LRQKKHAKIIVKIRHGAYGRPGILHDCFLFNGDDRRQTVDKVHIGLFELGNKTTRECGKRFHEAALALGVDGIEGK